jgi:hypothetical protein
MVVIGEILSPNVRQTIYVFWSGYEPNGPEWIRAPGLIIGLAYTSVIQLVGLLIGLLLVEKIRGIEKNLIFAGIVFIGISLIFTGRTGLVLGIVLSPLLLLRRGVVGLKIGLIVTVFMLVIGTMVFSRIDPDKRGVILNWAFEWYPSQGRSESPVSLAALGDMWYLPETIFGVLIGSSRTYHQQGIDDPSLVASDIGYVAILHGIGVPGLILTSLPYVIFAFFAWHWRITSPVHAWSVLAAIVIFAIGNAKEVMFLTRWGWELTVLLMGALILKRYELAQCKLKFHI